MYYYKDLDTMEKECKEAEISIYEDLCKAETEEEVDDLYNELDDIRMDLDWCFWEAQEREEENRVIAVENYILGYSHKFVR